MSKRANSGGKPIANASQSVHSITRSSAAEYLTFVAAAGQGGVEAIYADENVWLTQKMMGLLYDVETQTINYHLKKVFADRELGEESVIRNFRITAADGKSYDSQTQAIQRFFATVQNKQSDVTVAKNYLTESEMAQLQRLVSAYLDLAEDMALRQIPMTMQDRLHQSDFDRVLIGPAKGVRDAS